MFGRAQGEKEGIPEKTGSALIAAGELRPEEPFTDLQLPDGRVVRLPTQLLLPTQAAAEPMLPEDGAVIPVIEESLTVGKRTVETGKVVLRTSVQEFEQAVDEALTSRTYKIDRVPLNQKVAAAPEMRREGSTTIYPVVEERLVFVKELVLVEEVHVTEQITERRDTQMVRLRREQVEVERVSLTERARLTRRQLLNPQVSLALTLKPWIGAILLLRIAGMEADLAIPRRKAVSSLLAAAGAIGASLAVGAWIGTRIFGRDQTSC